MKKGWRRSGNVVVGWQGSEWGDTVELDQEGW